MSNQIIYTSKEELPLMLNVEQVAGFLNISRRNAYYLMHNKSFPTLIIGKRLVVDKYDLFTWIQNNTQ